MHVNWSALGQVLLVSLVVGVGVVSLFSVGVLVGDQGRTRASNAAAVLCFAACAAIIGYGVYLVVSR